MSELPLLLLEARRAHGGARAGGSTWDYGRPRSYARVDPDQSGARRRSPGPSGVADNDRSTTFESVDFARDDSFRAVLALIREFHDMAEPANCTRGSMQDFSCVGLWFGGGFLSGVLVAAFPLIIDSPDRHQLGLVQVHGGPDCARVLPCPVAGSGGITAPPPPLFLGPTQSTLA